MSIIMSYLPILSKYCLSIMKRPPAIIGVSITYQISRLNILKKIRIRINFVQIRIQHLKWIRGRLLIVYGIPKRSMQLFLFWFLFHFMNLKVLTYFCFFTLKKVFQKIFEKGFWWLPQNRNLFCEPRSGPVLKLGSGSESSNSLLTDPIRIRIQNPAEDMSNRVS